MSKHGWTYKKFEDCLKKFKTPSKIKSSEYYRSGLYPVISQEQEYISGYNNSAEKIFHHDKPVVVFGDHSRVVKYVDFDFIVGADGVKILLVRDELNPRFFYYYIKWIDVQSLGYSRHYKVLKENYIPVPPIGEQEAIVAELDKINSAIDELKLQVADLGTLAQATFYDMFGDPVANPKAWPVKKLGEIAQTGTGATPNRRKSKLYYGGTIPWVKTTEVHYDDIFDTEEKITDLAIKETNCKIYPPGTILLAMYGQGKTRGQIAKVKISASTNQACAAIELFNSNCNIDFIYEQLKLKYSQIRSMARGGNQANLNLRLVKSIEIILPPMPLQQEFAARVKAIEGAKAELKAQMADMQALLASRMQYWFD